MSQSELAEARRLQQEQRRLQEQQRREEEERRARELQERERARREQELKVSGGPGACTGWAEGAGGYSNGLDLSRRWLVICNSTES